MTLPTQIAILGAAGRMGRALIEALPAHPSLRLGAAFDRAEAVATGREAAPGVPLSSDLSSPSASFDVLIDFTRPEGTLAALDACIAAGRGTGSSDLASGASSASSSAQRR